MKQKIKQKNILLIFFLTSLIVQLKLGAQSDPICKAMFSLSTPTITKPPCNTLLNDIVPRVYDPILKVNVRFYVYTPTTNSASGYWTKPATCTTSLDAQKCIDDCNAIFINTITPTRPANGVGTFTTGARITFSLSGFQYIHSTPDYTYIPNAHNQVFDDSSINVYVGSFDGGVPGINGGAVADVPNYPGTLYNYILMRPYLNWNPNNMTGNYDWDNLNLRGGHLAHEIGHMLGLRHTTNTEHTEFDGLGCCSYSVSDYFSDTGDRDPCPGVLDTYTNLMGNGSNNLMSQNTACGNAYLSPQQCAVMQYYLRTDLYSYLIPPSFNDATTVNAAFDYTVSADATWLTDRYFKGNVTIPAGRTISVTCMVAMTHGAKIIIKKGGKLVIDGGKITNISGRLWEGIDVHGNPAVQQTGAYPASNHGQLIIKNGGTIENSINGVRNYGYDSGGNPWETAGIIDASGAKFINNVRDVEFLPSPFASISRFNDCEFTTTGQINDNGAPFVHVSLCGVNGVQFNACKFETVDQTHYPNGGQGIHSINATYKVKDHFGTSSKFIGLHEGISAYNSNPIAAVNVINSEFNNNMTGIEFSTMSALEISGNSFTMTQNNSKGVALNYCDLYAIKNNAFKGPGGYSNGSVGIYVSYSGVGAHRIYRNDFSSLHMGVSPQFDNSGVNNISDGLYMNCNVFNTNANSRDIYMNGNGNAPNFVPTVAKDQGIITFPTPNATKLVRNIYGAPYLYHGQKKWFVQGSSTKNINHANNSDAVTTVTPQPDYSSTLLLAVNSTSLNYSIHCLSTGNRPVSNPDCPCVNCCLYDDISLGLSQELAHTATLSSYVNATIDGGQTEDLLNEIAGSTDSDGLKDLLLGVSPYASDTVLKAFLASPFLDPEHLLIVHNANKPFSASVWEFADILGFTHDLEDQQNSQLISARENLEGELNLGKADLQYMYTEKLNYFLHDTLTGANDTVIKLLSQNLGGIPHTAPRLVNAYARGGYYARAFAYADSLGEDPRYTELMTLQTGILTLDTAKSGIYKLLNDPILMTLVAGYAADSTKAGSAAARGILNQLTGSNMNFVYLLPEGEESERKAHTSQQSSPASINENEINEWTKFSVFPNPANTGFSLLYNTSYNKEVYFKIADVLGKEYSSGLLRTNTVHEIKTESFVNGIYFITLVRDNKVIEKKKLIIIK